MPRCPVCGLPSPLYTDRSQQVRQGNASTLSIIWNVSMILMLVLLVINIASLVYASATMVMPELVAGSLQEQPIFIIFPTLAALFYLTGTTTILTYFILILAAIFFIYIHLAISDGKGVLRLIASPITSVLPRLRSKNRWTMVAQLFLAVTFFQFAYIVLLQGLGVQTNAPPGLTNEPTWLLMFDLANASVYEEIISRVALIGLPMFIGSILVRSMSLRYRDANMQVDARRDRRYLAGSLRYLVGGNVDRRSPKPVVKTGLILGVISAFFFGIAHSGWGDWKLFPAFVAGLALGYAFLRGGFVAAVLLHFAVDYLSAAAVLVQEDASLTAFLSILLLVLLFIGVGFLLYYVIYGFNLIMELFAGRRQSVPLPFPAAAGDSVQPTDLMRVGAGLRGAQSYPGDPQVTSFAAVCPYCSWPESRFVDGKLVCINCGKVR